MKTESQGPFEQCRSRSALRRGYW